MKKTSISILISTLLLFVLASASLEKSSSGAPASHTGAPGENTCGASGCHDDNPINKGSAKVEIEFDNKVKHIVAGETYNLKIKISDEKVTRFGFQLVALTTKSQENCGTLIIADSLRTKSVRNLKKFTDRNYVTYSFNGTDATSPGKSEWTVKWTAPKDLNQLVNFYVAAVSANDDMFDKGDHVYTRKLTMRNKRN